MRGMMTLFALRPSARAAHAVEHRRPRQMGDGRTDQPRLSDLELVLQLEIDIDVTF